MTERFEESLAQLSDEDYVQGTGNVTNLIRICLKSDVGDIFGMEISRLLMQVGNIHDALRIPAQY